MPSRDTQKPPIAYISKWNCNPPQWCASRVYGWLRVVKLLNLSQILRTASDLLKILPKNFHPRFHLTFFTTWREKEVAKLLWRQRWKVSQIPLRESIEIHTCGGHRYSCQVYRCPDSMNGYQGNKQNHKLKSTSPEISSLLKTRKQSSGFHKIAECFYVYSRLKTLDYFVYYTDQRNLNLFDQYIDKTKCHVLSFFFNYIGNLTKQSTQL